jgi:hypothetical protein
LCLLKEQQDSLVHECTLAGCVVVVPPSSPTSPVGCVLCLTSLLVPIALPPQRWLLVVRVWPPLRSDSLHLSLACHAASSGKGFALSSNEIARLLQHAVAQLLCTLASLHLGHPPNNVCYLPPARAPGVTLSLGSRTDVSGS